MVPVARLPGKWKRAFGPLWVCHFAVVRRRAWLTDVLTLCAVITELTHEAKVGDVVAIPAERPP